MKIILSVDSWYLLVPLFTQHFNPQEVLHYPNLFLGGAYLIIHNSWLQFGAYILLFQNAHHVPRGTPSPLILLVYWPTLRLWSEMAYTSLPPEPGIISFHTSELGTLSDKAKTRGYLWTFSCSSPRAHAVISHKCEPHVQFKTFQQPHNKK